MYDISHANPELFAALAKAGSYFLTSPEYPEDLVTPEGRVFSVRSIRFIDGMSVGKYRAVAVRHKSGAMVRRYVHRLVAEITHGHIPKGLEVCHSDGNPLNNAESNLRWDTRAGNHADKARHGTSAHGERNPMAKLTQSGVAEIRRRVAAGETQRSLCAEFGVSPMTISRVVRGETWSSRNEH